MTDKFHEGQQVWVCANLGGQLVREKGMVLGVTADGILAGSFAGSTKPMAVYPLGTDGRGENVWLEQRLLNYLAIDPGASGGIAWTDRDGIVRATKMPDTMPEQVDFLRARAVEQPGIIAVVEKTGGYMPGNSGPAAATFARHCGNLDAALYALSIPVRPVSPSVWMKKLGMPKLTKPERKAWLKDFSARRYPHLTVTLATADALALLAWAVDTKVQ